MREDDSLVEELQQEETSVVEEVAEEETQTTDAEIVPETEPQPLEDTQEILGGEIPVEDTAAKEGIPSAPEFKEIPYHERYYLKYRELCPGHKALFSEDFSYDLSSTELRDKLSAGEDCTELLPDGVYEYIVKNNLYRKESL